MTVETQIAIQIAVTIINIILTGVNVVCIIQSLDVIKTIRTIKEIERYKND